MYTERLTARDRLVPKAMGNGSRSGSEKLEIVGILNNELDDDDGLKGGYVCWLNILLLLL